MVFHRLKIRSKATNVAEIESKNIRGSVKTHYITLESGTSLDYKFQIQSTVHRLHSLPIKNMKP